MTEKKDNPPPYETNRSATSNGGDSRPLPDGWVKQWDDKYVLPHD